MKKIFFMAFVALSVSAMAQQVTPVNITLAEFNVDSLRTLYMTEPIMYRASLDAVALSGVAAASSVEKSLKS